MEYQGMKRKQLQALCKKHGIPANKSNLEMANLLASSTLKENVNCKSQGGDGEVCKDAQVPKTLKKVRFSPETETLEYEPTACKRRGRRKAILPSAGKKRGRGAEKIGNVDVSDKARPVLELCEEDGKVIGGLVRRQLRNREVVIEESGEGGGEGLGVTRKYSTRRGSGKRGNGILLLDGDGVSEENVLMRSKRKVRKCKGTPALLSDESGKTQIVGRITRGKAKAEKKTSVIENKNEAVEVRDECEKVLQLEEALRGLGQNALRQESIVCQKGVAKEILTREAVEPGNDVRRSQRNEEKCKDSEPIPQEVVRRITRLGAQFAGNAFAIESGDKVVQVREECKGAVLEESSKGLGRNISRRKPVAPQKGKVGSDGPHVKRGTRKRSRNSDLEVVMETEASEEPREEIEEAAVPIGHLRSREVLIEESGGGRGRGDLVVPRKYSTRKTSRKRGNDESSDGIDRITRAQAKAEEKTSGIDNKTETIEVQDECEMVLQLEEPLKGLDGNALRKKSNVHHKEVECEIVIGKGVEHGEVVRRSNRNVAKFTDSGPIPQEVVRRITGFGAQFAANESVVKTRVEVDEVKKERKGAVQLEESSKRLRRNASRQKSVAPPDGKVGSDEPQVKRETRKLSRNSNLEVVMEVEDSVESREENEKDTVPVGHLRRSRRNTVSLHSADELEMGQAVGRIRQASEQVSGRDVHVMDEPLMFSRSASRHTSIATSNEMDENVECVGKVGQLKQNHESVLEKETPAVVGESSVVKPTRQSMQHVSKSDLGGSSVSSETVENKQQNTSRLPIMMEEDACTEEPLIERTGMTMLESAGDKNHSSLNCSKVLKPSNKRNESKSKSSGIRRIDFVDVSAVYFEAEEGMDTTTNLEETQSPTSLKLVGDSTHQETPKTARKLVDLNEETNIVVHDTTNLVPDGIADREVDDQSFRSSKRGADFVNDNSAQPELAEFQIKACVMVFPADSFLSANQSDIAGEPSNISGLEKGLEREESSMGNDISYEGDHVNEVDRISAQDVGVCGLEKTEKDIATTKNEHEELFHNGIASPVVGTEIVIENMEATFEVDGNFLPPIDETLAQFADEKDDVVLEGNSNVSELYREECSHELLEGEGIHLITPEKKDADGVENYSGTIISLQSHTLCTSPKDNDEHQQVSGTGSKRLSFCVHNFSMERIMQRGGENQPEDQHVSSITDSHVIERAAVLHEPESFLPSTRHIDHLADEKIITEIDSNCEDEKAVLEGLQADALPQSSLEELQDEKEGNTVIAKSAYDEVLSQENFGDCTGENREVKVHFHEYKGGKELSLKVSTAPSSPELLSEKLHDNKGIVAESNCSIDAVIDVPIRGSDIEQCEMEEESGHAVEVELGDHSRCQEAAAKENTVADSSFTQAICQESEFPEGKRVNMMFFCSGDSHVVSNEMVSASRLPIMIEEAAVTEEPPIEHTEFTVPEATIHENHLSLNCNEVLKTSEKRKVSKSKMCGSGIGFVDVSDTEQHIDATINLEEIQAPSLLKVVEASTDQEIPETASQHAVLNEEANTIADDTETVVPEGIVEGDVDDQSCQFLKSGTDFVNDNSAEPGLAEFQTKACELLDGERIHLICPEEKDTEGGEKYSAAIVSLPSPDSLCTFQKVNKDHQQVSGIGNNRLLFYVGNLSMDRKTQHQEKNQLEDQPTASFTYNHAIEGGDAKLHEPEDFISYPCDIDNTEDEEIITKTNSSYEDEKAVLEGVQADALCHFSIEELQDEKKHNTATANIAYDEVLCQKNSEDCIGEKREEVSFYNNDGSLEAITALGSPNSPKLFSKNLNDYKEMFAERNSNVAMDGPSHKLCDAVMDKVSGKHVDRESDIEQLEMKEESRHSVEIERGDHSGCRKVAAKVNIGADTSFIQTIGEESEVSEEKKAEMMIVCSSDSHVARKEIISGTLVEKESNAVECTPAVRDETVECALVVDLCDHGGCREVAAKVNDCADANLTWTICQESEFSEGKNTGLRDNTSKSVKRICKFNEDSKSEVGDSKVNSFAQVIVGHLDELEAAEVHDSGLCDDICRIGRAIDKETHTASIKRLDMKEAKSGGNSQQNNPVGSVKVFSDCGDEFSDAGPDALSEIVSAEFEDFDKTLNGVVDNVLELEVRAGRLDKMDVLEPERSAFMDVKASEIKENAGKTDDDLKFKDTNIDSKKDHFIAIPQDIVNGITQHVIEEELLDENNSDHNIISKDACRNIKVDADEACAVTISEKAPVSSDILKSSRKLAKQNSLERILFSDLSFGKSEMISCTDPVSELSVFSSDVTENVPAEIHAGSALFTKWEMNLIQGNGEQNQVQKSDREALEENLISKDSWHTMPVKENATVVEQLGQFAEKQLGKALLTVTDELFCDDGDLSNGLDYKSGIDQQFDDKKHNDEIVENENSYVSTDEAILIEVATNNALDKYKAECASDDMKEVESISYAVVQGICESRASTTNKEVCMATIRKENVPEEVGIGQILLPVISDEASHEMTVTIPHKTLSSCIKPEESTSAKIISFAEEFESEEYCKDVSNDADGKETTCDDKGSNPTEGSQIFQEDDEVTNDGSQKTSNPQKVAKKQCTEHEDEANEPAFFGGSDCLTVNRPSYENKSKSHAMETDGVQFLHKLDDKVLTVVHSKEVADFEHLLGVISPFKCKMVVDCSADSAVSASSHNENESLELNLFLGEGEQEAEKSDALALQTNLTSEGAGQKDNAMIIIEQTGRQVAEEEHGEHRHQMEVEVADIAAEEDQWCQLKLPSPQKTSSLAKEEESNCLCAKLSTSSVMKRKNTTGLIQGTPQKVLYSSDMKENAPSIKRQQIGNLTAPKTLSKRRALEDLRKNKI